MEIDTDNDFETIKKAKYISNPHVEKENDDMPSKYRHIRSVLRSNYHMYR